MPGATDVAYHAALEAIASRPDEGYVLVLVPDEHDDDVLAEVYPLLHAAVGEHLRGFDQVSAGCLPQNCGPRPLAVPPPLARSWPAAPAEEWCFELYYDQPRGPLVVYADLPTGLFTREGAQRYLDAFRPGDFVLQNAPARCVACSLFEDEWTCHLRENAMASERQLRRLRFPPVPPVTRVAWAAAGATLQTHSDGRAKTAPAAPARRRPRGARSPPGGCSCGGTRRASLRPNLYQPAWPGA